MNNITLSSAFHSIHEALQAYLNYLLYQNQLFLVSSSLFIKLFQFLWSAASFLSSL